MCWANSTEHEVYNLSYKIQNTILKNEKEEPEKLKRQNQIPSFNLGMKSAEIV